jgi:hypothetical protein
MTASTRAGREVTGFVIDRELPVFDVVITEAIVVDADVANTYEAMRTIDLLTVRTPLLLAAFWVRGLPERLGLAERAPAPKRVSFAAGDEPPGWFQLADIENFELAVGAVGRFWTPKIVWHDVAREDFAAFREPGWGKIACDFRVRECGEGRTLLTYECRTATTSAEAKRRFARYWKLIRPFVGHIMRATLATIARNAERAPLNQERA